MKRSLPMCHRQAHRQAQTYRHAQSQQAAEVTEYSQLASVPLRIGEGRQAGILPERASLPHSLGVASGKQCPANWKTEGASFGIGGDGTGSGAAGQRLPSPGWSTEQSCRLRSMQAWAR